MQLNLPSMLITHDLQVIYQLNTVEFQLSKPSERNRVILNKRRFIKQKMYILMIISSCSCYFVISLATILKKHDIL